MKKTAILIDGEWLRMTLKKVLGPLPNGVTADIMYHNAIKPIDRAQEDLCKVFYYDSEPFTGKAVNPLSQQTIDFENSPGSLSRKRFFRELGRREFVALRRGYARPNGWTLTRDYAKKAITQNHGGVPTASDIYYSLEQKGVDMRIGIDVATLALKKLVDRIILFSGDCDMIPAIKLARREGLQVFLIQIQSCPKLADALVEDCDSIRHLKVELP